VNDIELDAARLEDLERAPGLASTGVVVDDDLSHPPRLSQFCDCFCSDRSASKADRRGNPTHH